MGRLVAVVASVVLLAALAPHASAQFKHQAPQKGLLGGAHHRVSSSPQQRTPHLLQARQGSDDADDALAGPAAAANGTGQLDLGNATNSKRIEEQERKIRELEQNYERTQAKLERYEEQQSTMGAGSSGVDPSGKTEFIKGYEGGFKVGYEAGWNMATADLKKRYGFPERTNSTANTNTGAAVDRTVDDVMNTNLTAPPANNTNGFPPPSAQPPATPVEEEAGTQTTQEELPSQKLARFLKFDKSGSPGNNNNNNNPFATGNTQPVQAPDFAKLFGGSGNNNNNNAQQFDLPSYLNQKIASQQPQQPEQQYAGGNAFAPQQQPQQSQQQPQQQPPVFAPMGGDMPQAMQQPGFYSPQPGQLQPQQQYAPNMFAQQQQPAYAPGQFGLPQKALGFLENIKGMIMEGQSTINAVRDALQPQPQQQQQFQPQQFAQFQQPPQQPMFQDALQPQQLLQQSANTNAESNNGVGGILSGLASLLTGGQQQQQQQPQPQVDQQFGLENLAQLLATTTGNPAAPKVVSGPPQADSAALGMEEMQNMIQEGQRPVG